MTTTADHLHPVLAAVAGVHGSLDPVAGAPVWSMRSAELAATIVEVHRAQARLAELELRLVHQADLDGLGSEVGAADTMAWWANTTHQTRPNVVRRLRLADAVGRRPVVQEGMTVGIVAEDQALVITRTLDDLPPDVDSDVVDLAEKELVRLAAQHDAKALNLLGKRILAVVAPDVGDEQERRALEREEDQAAQACRFTMSDDGHGLCHFRGTLPTAHGAMLKKHLLALAAPKHRAATTGGRACRDLTSPQRLGQAFRELVEHYPTDQLPHAGGVCAQVNVTMTLDAFTAESDQPALLDTGERTTAGEARRLACGAGIVPVVLDGASQPLDVGRMRRFHTPAQRTAIALRDKTCTADGCDSPPGMCHVHHDKPWSKKGDTTVNNGRLLCPKHHRMAHQNKYTMKAVKNGRVIFARS